jgi:hypothetical protein
MAARRSRLWVPADACIAGSVVRFAWFCAGRDRSGPHRITIPADRIQRLRQRLHLSVVPLRCSLSSHQFPLAVETGYPSMPDHDGYRKCSSMGAPSPPYLLALTKCRKCPAFAVHLRGHRRVSGKRRISRHTGIRSDQLFPLAPNRDANNKSPPDSSTPAGQCSARGSHVPPPSWLTICLCLRPRRR